MPGSNCEGPIFRPPEVTGLPSVLNSNLHHLPSTHSVLYQRPQARNHSKTPPSSMLGNSFEFFSSQDARRTKRPRNTSFNAEFQQVLPAHLVHAEDQAFGMEVEGDQSGASKPDGNQAKGSTPSKIRVEEKNNRKLSCKECRRQVIYPYQTVSSRLKPASFIIQTEAQGRRTPPVRVMSLDRQ